MVLSDSSHAVIVLAASEWRLKNWRKEDYNFDNFKEWLRVGRSVLLCLSRSSPNSKLSTQQLATIQTIGRSILVLFEEVLRRSRAKGSQQHRVDDDVHK